MNKKKIKKYIKKTINKFLENNLTYLYHKDIHSKVEKEFELSGVLTYSRK